MVIPSGKAKAGAVSNHAVPGTPAQALDYMLVKASGRVKYHRYQTRPAKDAVKVLYKAAVIGVSGSLPGRGDYPPALVP